jgi:hypothetical protein
MKKDKNKITVKFLRNYTPRKSGEVVELEKRVAEFYLSLGVAVEHTCECKEGKDEQCKDCNKASEPIKKNKQSINKGSFSSETKTTSEPAKEETVVETPVAKTEEIELLDLKGNKVSKTDESEIPEEELEETPEVEEKVADPKKQQNNKPKYK